jgi:5-methylcytosine-specific restriction enzyme A
VVRCVLDTGDALSACRHPLGAVPPLAVPRVPDLVLLIVRCHWHELLRTLRVLCHVQHTSRPSAHADLERLPHTRMGQEGAPRPCLRCGVPTRGPDHAEAKAPRDAQLANARTHTQTTKQRGYDAAWRRVRALVLANDRQCHWSGARGPTVDHVIPISQDPSLRLSLENLVPACRPCDSARTSRSR